MKSLPCRLDSRCSLRAENSRQLCQKKRRQRWSSVIKEKLILEPGLPFGLSQCKWGEGRGADASPFLPEEPSPLTLSLLSLSTPGGTFRLIFLVRRTRPSPPQVLQGVAFSPDPSQSGHVDICRDSQRLRDQRKH